MGIFYNDTDGTGEGLDARMRGIAAANAANAANTQRQTSSTAAPVGMAAMRPMGTTPQPVGPSAPIGVIYNNPAPIEPVTEAGGINGTGTGGYTGAGGITSSAAQQQLAAAQAAWAERERARANAYNAIVNARRQNYAHGVGQVNSSIDTGLQEAYVNRMMSERNLGQQLSALGRSGGAAESTMLGLQNNYGSTRGLLERQRAQAIAEMQNQLQLGLAEDESNYQNAVAEDSVARYQALADIQNQYAGIAAGVGTGAATTAQANAPTLGAVTTAAQDARAAEEARAAEAVRQRRIAYIMNEYEAGRMSEARAREAIANA